MGNRRSPVGILRAPLGHWIIAMILAAGVGWGTHAWLAYRTTQSAQTATLAWDASVAKHMDPSLADAVEPAVATAQSILSDSAVAALARSARLSSSAGSARIGEFRSRLELRQSSASRLQVRFLDSTPERASHTANSVAGVLAAGTTSAATLPATPAPSAPPRVVPPAPVKTPPAPPADNGSSALAHSLQQLGADLSATQTQMDSLNTSALQRREHPELSSYRESKEQQLMTAQVGAALKQVAGLRADPANGPAAQEPLRQIQEALRSVWPASRSDRTVRGAAGFAGFNAAGVNASRLREERAEYAQAIEVVQKEQRAVQRLASALPPQPAQAAAQAPAVAPSSSPSSAAPPPPIAESELPKPPVEQPFQLLQPAGTPAPVPLWPGIVAACCCGLFYLAIAGSRYRQEEEEEYPEESAAEPQRMITPARPMRPAGFFESAESRSGDTSENAEPRSTDFFAGAEDSQRMIAPARPLRPAGFFESAQPRSGDTSENTEPRSTDFFAGAEDSQRMIAPAKPIRSAGFFESAQPRSGDTSENAEPRSTGFFERAESSPTQIVLPSPQIEPPDLPGSSLEERSTDVGVQEITMDADESRRPFQEEVVSEEGGSDPWIDNMMKTLSATSIGRLYEKPASGDRQDAPEDDDGQRRSIHPDRMAG